MYMRGVGQFATDTGTGIDTSGVNVSEPTSDQIDYALNAMAQQACLDTPGSIWNPTAKSCTGDGTGSFGPPGTPKPSGPSITMVLAVAAIGFVLLSAGGR